MKLSVKTIANVPRAVQQTTRAVVLKVSDTTFISARQVKRLVERLNRLNGKTETDALITQLLALLDSDSAAVRQAAVEALSGFMKQPTKTVAVATQRLTALLSDSESSVRDSARKTLSTLTGN